jgi:hypothetical protein
MISDEYFNSPQKFKMRFQKIIKNMPTELLVNILTRTFREILQKLE